MAKYFKHDEVYLFDTSSKTVDRRFRGYVDGIGSNCTWHTGCAMVKVAWNAGNVGWTHTIYLVSADIVTEKPETDNKGLSTQERCNCESQACQDKHHLGACSGQVNAHSPKMTYLDKVCVPCARRITEEGGATYLIWPDQVKTDTPPETDKALETLKAVLQDAALKVHQNALSARRKAYWKVLSIVEDLPFVVIGCFAYVRGHDGDLYAAPYVQDIQSKSGMSVDWYQTVKITEPEHSGGFPTSRIKNAISDILDASGIMRQRGAVVKTDKLVRPDQGEQS